MAVLAGCGLVPTVPPAARAGDPASSGPSSVASGDLLRTAVRASVRVRTVGCDSVETGSGFAVDAHTFVTNAHVVAGAQQLQVDTWDGHELTVAGAVVATVADLAVVRTEDDLPTWLALADHDPAAGTEVTVVGYPRGEALARAPGSVSGIAEDPLRTTTFPVLTVETQVAPGSSGSAVVDGSGAVVGVVYAGAVTGEHAYAVPVSLLREVMASTASASPKPAPSSGGC